MAQTAEELRRDMERRRSAIGHTVDEIENRVSPGHVMARGRYRMRNQMTRWKDNVMGEVQDYREDLSSGTDRMSDSIRDAPDAIERRTRGNPLAVGLIAVGAGALVASMLPETRQERRLAAQMEPQVERAASEVSAAGREMTQDVKESASEGMERVRDSARAEGQEAKEDARRAGESIREGA